MPLTPSPALAQQVEDWAPRFSFWGFRWCQVQISGPLPSSVKVVSMEGEFVYADLKSVGDFQCSNELWNRFACCFCVKSCRRRDISRQHPPHGAAEHQVEHGPRMDGLPPSREAGLDGGLFAHLFAV